jgi:hypothetical protein
MSVGFPDSMSSPFIVRVSTAENLKKNEPKSVQTAGATLAMVASTVFEVLTQFFCFYFCLCSGLCAALQNRQLPQRAPRATEQFVKSQLHSGCILEPPTPNPSPSPSRFLLSACRGARARRRATRGSGRTGGLKGRFLFRDCLYWSFGICLRYFFKGCNGRSSHYVSFCHGHPTDLPHAIRSNSKHSPPVRRSQRDAILSHLLQHSPFLKTMRKIVKWVNGFPFLRCLLF